MHGVSWLHGNNIKVSLPKLSATSLVFYIVLKKDNHSCLYTRALNTLFQRFLNVYQINCEVT